jgi:hypothetical protein
VNRDLAVPLSMSRTQLKNLVTENVERMHEHGLSDWLPQVVADVQNVEVGVWRCPSGEITCAEGECGECDCCDYAGLWESPFDWKVECLGCGQPALLVEYVGVFDYSMALEARAS